MVDIEVLQKLRDGLLDDKIIVVSDNPKIDRINLIEALTHEIAKKERSKRNGEETS